MTDSIIIQATRYGETIDERICSTRAGARRSLVAMIDRAGGNWPQRDVVSWQSAREAAERWEGDRDFRVSISPYIEGRPMRIAAILNSD